jgi:hypothetical protein
MANEGREEKGCLALGFVVAVVVVSGAGNIECIGGLWIAMSAGCSDMVGNVFVEVVAGRNANLNN